MSGLKYHGGMKGLYAMLALTEASLLDDDVDTTTPANSLSPLPNPQAAVWACSSCALRWKAITVN